MTFQASMIKQVVLGTGFFFQKISRSQLAKRPKFLGANPKFQEPKISVLECKYPKNAVFVLKNCCYTAVKQFFCVTKLLNCPLIIDTGFIIGVIKKNGNKEFQIGLDGIRLGWAPKARENFLILAYFQLLCQRKVQKIQEPNWRKMQNFQESILIFKSHGERIG